MKTQAFSDTSEFAIFHQNCDKSWLDPITQRAKFLFATGLKIDAKRFFWQFINISRSLAALQKNNWPTNLGCDHHKNVSILFFFPSTLSHESST